MKWKIFLISLVFIAFSCKNKDEKQSENSIKISERVHYVKDNDGVEIHSGKFKYFIKKTDLPFKKVVLLSSSHAGYFLEMQKQDVISGISSPEYVYSPVLRKLISEGKIQNVGSEQQYNIEKIIALKPDAVICNYVESFENTYGILRKNQIKVIFIDEYLEDQPLQKSKLIELFGVLIGEEELAKQKYKVIEEHYNQFKKLAKSSHFSPKVLANEMYGNQWFVPGGNSYLAQFIKDANGDYIFKDNKNNTSLPFSFEEVFVKAQNAEVWVNIGDRKSKSDLLAFNPNYAKMKVYQKGKLYSLGGSVQGKSNDVFESGVVRADLFLKDYIKIFHPNVFSTEDLKYLKEIK